jgi:flagellar biosynthesis protein FliQ
MTPDTVIEIGTNALQLAALLASIPLLAALAVGLLVGVFQAATQINEMTLSFIPKLIVLVLTLVAGGPWMLQQLMEFTSSLFRDIPGLVA